jgi:hypothetical protein
MSDSLNQAAWEILFERHKILEEVDEHSRTVTTDDAIGDKVIP